MKIKKAEDVMATNQGRTHKLKIIKMNNRNITNSQKEIGWCYDKIGNVCKVYAPIHASDVSKIKVKRVKKKKGIK